MTDDTHDPNCSGCPACSGRDSELKQLATDVQELLGATVFQAARSRAYDTAARARPAPRSGVDLCVSGRFED